MRLNCGLAWNCPTPRWLVETLKACMTQNVIILSFHPISLGAMASATWRPTLLPRMPSPSLLSGAPLQHGRTRLTKPRGFRECGIGFGSWTLFCCLFKFSKIWFVFSKLSIWKVLVFQFVQNSQYVKKCCFPVIFLQSTVTQVPLHLCKSRLYQAENDNSDIRIYIPDLLIFCQGWNQKRSTVKKKAYL